ncbi:MAG: sigma-70 family RNA polymerase sigma factor [Deltaproteobacteria bacterium]|nr:sigma-70 family RNA polymerase sigma factor [Deltaproteobacteria bacterium]
MEKAQRAEKNQELSRALSGNVDGNFEKLIRAFQDRLYSFSLRLTNNRADAEEIVQEGFVRAFRALKAYPPQRVEGIDLKPWLYRIVLNVFQTRVRKALPRNFSFDDSNPTSGKAEEAAAGPNPEEAAERGEIRKQLEQAVASLPERYRVPLVLRYVENIAYSKIKDILKQPEGTVKSNVHRGVQLLRKNVSKMNRREKQ